MYRLQIYFQNQEGQGMVEYAYILAFVAMIVFLGLQFLGINLRDFILKMVSF